jgi:NhaP-type Na+/H+ and K+/H+ antiporter
MFCSNCGKNLNGSEAFCSGCGHAVHGGEAEPTAVPNTQSPALPMKWYKFVIYFQLLAGVLLHVYSAFQYATGMVYGGFQTAGMVFTVYPGLRSLDYAMATVSLAMAIFAIVVRQRLARFKASAFPALYVYYMGGFVCSLLYAIAATLITKINIFDVTMVSSLIGALIGSSVTILLSIPYFNKRKLLFH